MHRSTPLNPLRNEKGGLLILATTEASLQDLHDVNGNIISDRCIDALRINHPAASGVATPNLESTPEVISSAVHPGVCRSLWGSPRFKPDSNHPRIR